LQFITSRIGPRRMWGRGPIRGRENIFMSLWERQPVKMWVCEYMRRWKRKSMRVCVRDEWKTWRGDMVLEAGACFMFRD
jgi:hypothetical protein